MPTPNRAQLIREIELLLPTDAPDVGRDLVLQVVADSWREQPLAVLVRLRQLATARELADQSAVADNVDDPSCVWCSHCEHHVFVYYDSDGVSRCAACKQVL